MVAASDHDTRDWEEKFHLSFDAWRRGEVKKVKEVEEVKKIRPDLSRRTFRARSLG
jgi:hypothetical protein